MRRLSRGTRVTSIEPTRLVLRDLGAECVAAIVAKPARAVLTTLGTVLGVGTLIVILGLTSTATGQVSARFDARAATTVSVVDTRPVDDVDAPFPLTEEAVARVRDLHGVTGAGVIYTVDTDDRVASAVPGHTDPVSLPVRAVSPGAWSAIGPTLAAGRTYDAWTGDVPVVVLGPAAASNLGITGQGAPTSITIGDTPFLIAGVLADVERHPDLLLAVIVPTGIAETMWGAPTPKQEAELLIATQPGAALQVAAEAATTVSYLAPGHISVSAPPDPRTLRDSISGDLAALFYALALICLLIGTVGIANTTLVAVMERSSEIGLRRALGATGRHIAAQVLAESAGLGVLGGILGAALGLAAVIVIAVARGWSPILDPDLLLWAPLLGLVTGALAGFYPARKATRIEPTEALRGA
jgi:putative ABC transport system permease protein